MLIRIHLRTPVFLCAILVWATAARAGGEEIPTNLRLIAAMPPGTESVLVYRYPALTAEDSAMKREFEEMLDGLGTPEDQDERNRLHNVVMRYVAMSNPLVQVEGGSQFTAPDGVGVGNFNGRSIWIVEHPLARLMQRLAARKDIDGELTPFKLGDVQCYETAVDVRISIRPDVAPVTERRLYAFPSTRSVVVTECRDDVEYILKALGAKEPKVPKQWEPFAAALDIESPIIILRRYDPSNDRDYWSPAGSMNPHYGRTQVEGFGLVLKSAHDVMFSLRCVAKQRERAAAYYKDHAFRQENFTWSIEERPEGFTAEITGNAARIREANIPITLITFVLFGPNVFI